MSDLMSSAYDTFGHCSKCGSNDVTPSTERFHVQGKCVKASGDRSLLRAPTTAAHEAAMRVILVGSQNQWPDNLAVRMRAALEAAYAVDGLRGTEDRALRDTIEEISSEAYHAIPYYAYGDNEAACQMAHRLENIARLARVLRESVEGEQRT